MTYVPLQFGVEYLNSQNSGFWDSLYIIGKSRVSSRKNEPCEHKTARNYINYYIIGDSEAGFGMPNELLWGLF